MPLKSYSVLVGRPVRLALDDDQDPHLEVLIDAAGVSYRIAVNVRSNLHPHPLLFERRTPFVAPQLEELAALPPGLTSLRARPDLGLDYVRDGLVFKDDMAIAPYELEGPKNDLKEFLLEELDAMIVDPDGLVFAFGEPWGPEAGKPDQYFGFQPGRGIHDIHMNQGNSGQYKKDNGPNQDGGLFLRSGLGIWSAIFLAFQSQSWDTDPVTGHPRTGPVPPRPPIGRDPVTEAAVQIIAALVNPSGTEEGRESVTILNRSDKALTLTGWSIRDASSRDHRLAGTLAPGETLRNTLPGDTARLGNKGGRIELVDQAGTLVHSVSYSKGDVGTEDWTLLF